MYTCGGFILIFVLISKGSSSEMTVSTICPNPSVLFRVGRRCHRCGSGQDMMSVTIITVSSSLNIYILFLKLNN